MSEIDRGDLVVSFFTGYLTAPLATGKKVYDILSFGGLNVMDKYIKSKVGSDKPIYTTGQAGFDFGLGAVFKWWQIHNYKQPQESNEAKRLWKYLDHLQRSYKHLSTPRILELQKAEKAAINFGNRLPDILTLKTYKTLFEKLFRSKGEPIPEVPEGIR